MRALGLAVRVTVYHEEQERYDAAAGARNRKVAGKLVLAVHAMTVTAALRPQPGSL